MIKSILFIAMICCATLSFAQVGIGTTTPDNSSILDITSSSKGVLFPRIGITGTTDQTTITSPTKSLLIYNTNKVADVTPGFYYWDGTKWNRLKTTTEDTSTNDWSLLGNSGTTPGTHFLGTTDAKGLMFKANSKQVVAIAAPADSISTTSTLAASALNAQVIGYNSTVSAPSAITIGIKSNIGNSASSSFLLGNNSTIYHFNSIAIGNSNISNADYAVNLGFNTRVSGDRSVAIGRNAKASSWDVIALGNEANATSSGAMALGAYSSSTATNALALGYQATATQSNSIILGKYDNTDVKVGIGTNSPSAKLQLNGSFRFVDGNQSAGKVLTSDANGNATWQTPSSSGSSGSTGDAWVTSGNNVGDGGTTTKFLGTTSYAELNLKVNNTLMGKFHPNGGFSIGRNAYFDDSQHSFAIGEGADARGNQDIIAIGTNSKANSNQSLAIGKGANATANNTIALGLSSIASSYQSIAVGSDAQATSKNNALALGVSTRASGENSTALGNTANATAQNSTAVGYGANAINTNTIILGNNDVKVGIGTNTPSEKLQINGSIKIVDGTQGNGKILLSDANGKASWASTSSLTAGNSFTISKNLGTITSGGGSNIISITIPTANIPSSTSATLVITPENGLDDNVFIAWAKLQNTSTIRVKFINTGSTSIYNPYVKFYVKINEF
ncbi:hypothetical protein ACG2LH_17395 [Zhouia sp. PK063]|uniref:hypothetical protein n=1 Tax=Zhouia sp. PK063 TaxID=3373602 RepID=UPI00378FF85A